ncbi:glycosyltransferase family 2 protein [Flavihumibacter petaseus]|uniref:Putative glycosyltransferase n=1 Tax=Flavihumibacter petaseus NBRC 106054 TaxID=1220578 RepID=A0A0E9MWW1_9BACT|nr:glycosyltransferase family 2 protein [Flavihumibacter petaseus]GAO42074.1 putative glycosyltransferase [Flavihumibacter petaseus NBRC 106054]
MLPTSSLIIATYNWPKALQRCLKSVREQAVLPGEVLIADDGSREETKQLVASMQSDFPVPLRHIWQEDKGFRLAKIRNRANAAADGEYLIQVDGDLILHPDFVKDHLEAATPGYFIGGSRVILGREFSEKLLDNQSLQPTVFRRGISNRLNALHSATLGSAASRIIKTKNAYNIRGCNMSYWKRDFIRVNGYNELYNGWGREDTDLIIRLYNAGLKRTYFKLRGIVFHLWHKESSKNYLPQNDEILQATIRERLVVCRDGIDQYIQPQL